MQKRGMRHAFSHPKDPPRAFSLSAFPGRFFALCANLAWLQFACWIYPSLELTKKTLIRDDEEAVFILEALQRSDRSEASTYEVGDWVTLRRGVYKSDIGRVRKIDSTTGAVIVAVVPRIGVNERSRTLRPDAALFFPPESESEIMESGHYVFKKGIYKDGLLELRIPSILHLKKANPSLSDIGLFIKTEASLGELDRDEPFLQAGDKVRVLTTGIFGKVKLLLGDTVTVVHAKDASGNFVDETSKPNQVYLEAKYGKKDIERVLLEGMDVIVRVGDYAGETGMVSGFSNNKETVRITTLSYKEVHTHF